MRDIWTTDDDTDHPGPHRLAGYTVEAIDGTVGKVDDHTEIAGETTLLVDTGFWIFGKTRLVPMDAVTAVDHQHECVTVKLSKHAVKHAPDWDAQRRMASNTHWDRHDRYYGPYN